MGQAIRVDKVRFRYDERVALDSVSLDVPSGSLFSIVGPNGGGKSTLFQLLATLKNPESGKIEIFGADTQADRATIRRKLAVVFQSPALDPKLTILENCVLQARLATSLGGRALRKKIDENVERLGLTDRLRDRVETLSGGLKRRAEIAKCLLTDPQLLLLDEPTAALDPLARREVWEWVRRLQQERGMTVVFTTHLLDEAEGAAEVAFLDEGKVLWQGKPTAWAAAERGEVVSIRTSQPEALRDGVRERFGIDARVLFDEVRFERPSAFAFASQVASAFPQWISSVTVSRPRLEDLFIEKTGRRLQSA